MPKNKYNKKIYKLFIEDQRDRSGKKISKYITKKDWNKLKKRDKERQDKIAAILKENINLTGHDYFMIAMIYQHGTKISHSKKAIKYSALGIKLNDNDSKWLFAAATDRLLMRRNKKQKYGTQYQKMKNGKWRLYPYDRKTTDKERAEYNVIPLKDALAKAELWNSTKKDPWNQKRKTIGITTKQ